jgi:hypothetical protein
VRAIRDKGWGTKERKRIEKEKKRERETEGGQDS